jgi:hypothetical protein
MAAHRERHAHDRITRLKEREIDGQVGGRAGVRLNVGVIRAKERLGAFDRQRLNGIDATLTFVVSTARVAFRILVREDRGSGFEHRARDVVF